MDAVFSNPSLDELVFSLSAWVVLCYVAAIAWYCWLKPRRGIEVSPSRRGLLLRAVASVVGLFVTMFSWKFQALALDSDLVRAVQTNDYDEAAHVFERARTAGVRLNKTVVRRASQKFIGAIDQQPEAWTAVTQCLNYQSSPISGTVQIAVPTKRVPEPTHYNVPNANLLAKPTPSIFGTSVAPDIPEIRALDAESLNAGVKIGPAYLVMDGGWLRLDGLYVKRIIFRNVRITYAGQRPIELDQINFINCTFDIGQTARGRKFAQAVLTFAPSVTIKID